MKFIVTKANFLNSFHLGRYLTTFIFIDIHFVVWLSQQAEKVSHQETAFLCHCPRGHCRTFPTKKLFTFFTWKKGIPSWKDKQWHKYFSDQGQTWWVSEHTETTLLGRPFLWSQSLKSFPAAVTIFDGKRQGWYWRFSSFKMSATMECTSPINDQQSLICYLLLNLPYCWLPTYWCLKNSNTIHYIVFSWLVRVIKRPNGELLWQFYSVPIVNKEQKQKTKIPLVKKTQIFQKLILQCDFWNKNHSVKMSFHICQLYQICILCPKDELLWKNL